DPGGSSSGIGAGIAANFATVGIGEDTAGSIRVPSSFNNLFGIRVTTGLISRSGMCPIINFQDTPGPMARNVKDLSTVLDVIAGYDKEDSATSMSVFSGSLGNFGSSLMGGELRGSRIGILRDSFPGRDEDVSLVMERAIHTMSSNGADIVDPVEISDLPARIKNSGLYDIQTKYDLNGFIRTRKGSPMKSVEDIVSAGMYHELIDILEYVSRGESLPEEHPEYYRRRFGQNELRKAIIELIVSSGLDAIMYPSARILPPAKDDIRGRKWAGLGFPVNSFISSHSGCPSIAVPAGFTSGGIPVGFELLAKPLDEQKLLNLAYSYELVANPRRSPETTPDLA
ncbi:MAG TPA: amidase, partial [Thermoplasmataceae archaeon]|nr:amidase [Thermoplasmataceae archaeon]